MFEVEDGPRAQGHGATRSASASTVSPARASRLEAEAAREREERERVLALHTKSVRDVRECRAQLARARDEAHRLKRACAMARCLAHSRSRLGRASQLLRVQAAIGMWRLYAK
eukprot:2280934-Pleurochrysis_carterae.AAC.1